MTYPDKIKLVLMYKRDLHDDEIFTEKVDAEKVGAFYKLVHVPAFAPNIAYGDIVKVVFDEGEYHFDSLIEESGYSVVHIVLLKPENFETLTGALTGFGCGVNTHVANNYLVVSVPPEVSYQPIHFFLDSQASIEAIDYRESCISNVHAATDQV